MLQRVRSNSEPIEYRYYNKIRRVLKESPISQEIIELARTIFQKATKEGVWKTCKADAEGLIQSAVRELAASRSSSSSSDSPLPFERKPILPSPKKSLLSNAFSFPPKSN